MADTPRRCSLCATDRRVASACGLHPHIYSDAELAAFFARTDRCHYCSGVPLRHLVMPVLFRTIYACGLRCPEARPLRVEDVDPVTGVLLIRDARAAKSVRSPCPNHYVLAWRTIMPSSASGSSLADAVIP